MYLSSPQNVSRNTHWYIITYQCFSFSGFLWFGIILLFLAVGSTCNVRQGELFILPFYRDVFKKLFLPSISKSFNKKAQMDRNGMPVHEMEHFNEFILLNGYNIFYLNSIYTISGSLFCFLRMTLAS